MKANNICAGEDGLIFPELWRPSALPFMTQTVSRHINDAPPAFTQAWYGERYREFAIHAEWLARSFLANAEKEAEGARKLWTIAGEAKRYGFRSEVSVHAADEARHARMYVSMLQLVFPDALTGDEVSAILESFPKYKGDAPEIENGRKLDALLDDLVQMNIGEIRTRIHQMLLRPVALAIVDDANRHRLRCILTSIYDDEGRHIIYTAELLERFAAEGMSRLIDSLYERRLKDFDMLTREEVGVGDFA